VGRKILAAEVLRPELPDPRLGGFSR